ncbi:MAG: uracil-DNA glycosylase [Deltaproteobacteria bacterium]|nr:uracil-DNA glycosylase [Deltaproteobacteria bacterium]
MLDLIKNLKGRIEWDRELGLQGYSKEDVRLDIPDFEYSPVKQQADEIQNISANISANTVQPDLHKQSEKLPVVSIEQNVIIPENNFPVFSSKNEQENICSNCNFFRRFKPVYETPVLNVKVAFVGDMPDESEAAVGIPFAGERGMLLNKMIKAMGLNRDNVLLLNIVKCQGLNPKNSIEHIRKSFPCSSLVAKQIMNANPKVIVALGQTPARFLLNTGKTINELRGNFFKFNNIPLMPTYHLNYMLKKSEAKKPVWEDLKNVMKLIN